jgi:predicted metal-dependent enzyme (double-stranded beta helix superfamily)
MDEQGQARLARLFADVRAVLAEKGVSDAGLAEAGQLLAVVAAEPWVREVELAPKHGGASESRVLRSDGPDDLTLTLARFRVEQATGVHDHGSWGVAVVVDGHDRYQRWERLDAGDEAGRARLRLVEEVIAGARDLVVRSPARHPQPARRGRTGARAGALRPRYLAYRPPLLRPRGRHGA